MNSYGFSEELENKIIEYCYQTAEMLKLTEEVFKRAKVRKNRFLEAMYDNACIKMEAMNTFLLTQDELEACFRSVQMDGILIDGFLNSKNEIIGIYPNDIFVFKDKIKIKRQKKQDNEVKD